MTTPRKEKKREARREEKAERAAALDKVIIHEPYATGVHRLCVVSTALIKPL